MSHPQKRKNSFREDRSRKKKYSNAPFPTQDLSSRTKIPTPLFPLTLIPSENFIPMSYRSNPRNKNKHGNFKVCKTKFKKYRRVRLFRIHLRFFSSGTAESGRGNVQISHTLGYRSTARNASVSHRNRPSSRLHRHKHKQPKKSTDRTVLYKPYMRMPRIHRKNNGDVFTGTHLTRRCNAPMYPMLKYEPRVHVCNDRQHYV